MKEIIFVVEEAPEGGCAAKALDASIFTEADDLAAGRVASSPSRGPAKVRPVPPALRCSPTRQAPPRVSPWSAKTAR